MQFLLGYYLRLDFRKEEAWIPIGMAAKTAQAVSNALLVCTHTI